MTNHIKFSAGQVIVEDGTIDHKAYVILAGNVEVFKSKGVEKITLARLGAGQIFGEMGLISDRPRAASVMALDDVELQIIDREEFNRLLKKDPEILIPIIRVLFERLRNVNSLLLSSAGQIGAAKSENAQPPVTICGMTERAGQALENKAHTITRFPYRVGRKTTAASPVVSLPNPIDVFSNNDLYLDDREPFNVSRNHFSINQQAGGFFIVDRGSTLGTIVNGAKIGGPVQNNNCLLDRTENEIIAGPANSPFKFKITIG